MFEASSIKYVIMFFLFVASVVRADTYSTVYLPMLTSVVIGESKWISGEHSPKNEYNYTVSKVPVTLPDSELDTRCGDVAFSGDNGCVILYMVPRYAGTSPSIYAHVVIRKEGFSLNTTVRQMLSRSAVQSGKISIFDTGPEVNSSWGSPREGCSYVTIIPEGSRPQINNVSYGGGFRTTSKLPALKQATESCVGTVPPNQYCSMNTASLDYDFGTIALSNWEAVSLEKTMQVYCSSSMKYKVSLISSMDSQIKLTNGGVADVRVDNSKVSSVTYSGSSGNNKHTVKVSLGGNPSKTGRFSGSSAMLVTYP